MKKITLIVVILATMNSCATICGGRITESQTTRPKQGEPIRRVRIAPLVLNAIFLPIGIPIDFLSGAAYRPKINNK